MKQILALSILILSTATAFASGASRQAPSFAGTYTYVSGTKIVFDSRHDSSKVEIPCPTTIDAKYDAATATIYPMTNGGELSPFSGINQSRVWAGNEYEDSYTTSNSLVYEEEGRQIQQSPLPPTNPYNPSPVNPAPIQAVSYRYSIEQQKDGTYRLSTSASSSKDACVYSFAP